MQHCLRRAFTLIDLAVAIACLAIGSATVIPVMTGMRTSSGELASLNNLVVIGAAHAVYAADYDGRQYTSAVDEIASYGDDVNSAMSNYETENGVWPPPLELGWGLLNGDQLIFFQYVMFFSGNRLLSVPISFDGFAPLGYFRYPNATPLHDYLGGRFYDPVFYAPNDVVVHDLVEPYFDSPWEYVETPSGPFGDVPYLSSYCMSAAALFDPDVFRAPPDGGWQDPWLVDDGLTAPGLFQALYPSLKTQFLEHHWNQNAPADRCNPAFSEGIYGDCEPYYYNHALASEPAALFYDMSVRLLPNVEVKAADEQLIDQTGYGLWSRDTAFGKDGYFNDVALDAVGLSHHVLTTDGILGRDTLSPPGGLGR